MIKIMGFKRGSGLHDIEAVQYYRTWLPLTTLAAFAEVDILSPADLFGRTNEDLGGRDLYTMCRMYRDDAQAFVDTIHDSGLLVFDSDDDLTCDYRLVSRYGKPFKKFLGLADYVTTSTPELALHLGQYTKKPPVVLENHIDAGGFSGAASGSERVIAGTVIGFSGTKTHWGDWYTATIPWLRIVEDYRLTPCVHGSPPGYLDFAPSFTLPQTPYSRYPALLSQFDILLCAVNTEDPFNAGKSAVKALECMCAGVVPICSRLGAYQRIYDQGAPIVLVEEETQDGWYEAMRSLAENEGYRLDLKSRGLAWVKEHRDIAVGYQKWLDAYTGMVNDER